MSTRRQFLKQILAGLVLVAGGSTGVFRYLTKDPSGEPEAAAIPTANAASPNEQPSPAPLPAIPMLSFFLLSDLHISSAAPSMADKLHTALKDISSFESPVDTMILGGDLTDFGRAAEYKQLAEVLGSYKLPPLYGNMGNHDYYDIWLTKKGHYAPESMPNGKTDAMSRKRFQEFFGGQPNPYHEVWLGGVHLILLSQEAYVQEKPEVGEGAWYSDEQLSWLENTMKSHEDGRPAFVFIHQPLPEPGADGGTHRLIRARRFRSILEPYRNVFVLSGHTHPNFNGGEHYNRDNSFHWFSNASVGKTRSTEPGGKAGTDVQGMYVQVYPHEVVVRGREFTNRSWITSAEWTIPLEVKG